MVDNNLRIKIKIGEREFEAEGPREAVEARWAEAKNWVIGDPTKPQNKENSSLPEDTSTHSTENLIFDVDQGKRTVRLRVLPPRGENIQRLSNALLLLLYGYQKALAKPEVPVIRASEDLRMSGFAGLKRLSRAFFRLETEGLAAKNGSGKGTHYRATNPGLESARALARSLGK